MKVGTHSGLPSVQANGISATDCKRLMDGGYATVESVAFAPRKELVKVNGLSDNKVTKIQEEGG